MVVSRTQLSTIREISSYRRLASWQGRALGVSGRAQALRDGRKLEMQPPHCKQRSRQTTRILTCASIRALSPGSSRCRPALTIAGAAIMIEEIMNDRDGRAKIMKTGFSITYIYLSCTVYEIFI